MKKYEVKNMQLKAIALALALALWLYVGLEKNPLEARTVQVPVVIENLADDLSADLSMKQIGVTIRGRSDNLRNLDTDSITASVDLSKAKVGDATYPVKVVAPKGINVYNVNPDKITVSVRESNGRHFKVTHETIGTLAEGLKLEGVAIDPKEVFVEGDASVLAQIDHLAVPLDLSQLTESGDKMLSVVAYSKDNWPLGNANIKIRPATVTVRYQVKKQEDTKNLEIQVGTQGSLPNGYVLSSLDIQPATVTVIGPKDVLDKVDMLSANNIDISGLTKDKRFPLHLQLPDGLKLKGNPHIEAVAHISKAKGMEVPIQIMGNTEGYHVSLSSESVYVSENGAEGAWIDITGLAPGTYQLNIQINGGDGGQVTPQAVEVTIS